MNRRAFLAAIAAPAVAPMSNLGHPQPAYRIGVDLASGPDETVITYFSAHTSEVGTLTVADLEFMYQRCMWGEDRPPTIWIESTAKGVSDAAL